MDVAILLRGLAPFVEEEAMPSTLPDLVISKISNYKESLYLARFKDCYGHSLDVVVKAWAALELDDDEFVLEELLAVLNFFGCNFSAIVIPHFIALQPPHIENARYLLARSASIVSRLHGKKMMGVTISPAIAWIDKKMIWYYKQEESDTSDKDNSVWTEHKLCGVEFAKRTTRAYETDNGDLRIECDITVYVLYHPEGKEGFWMFGPIEKERRRPFGFVRTVKKYLKEALKSSGIATMPSPSELTVVVAVTNMKMKALNDK